MVLVSMIPRSAVFPQIKQSVPVFQKEGTYPSYGLPFRQVALDNFDDALMTNMALTVDTSQPIRAAAFNAQAVDVTDPINQVKALTAGVTTNSPATSSYQRYWHGYLVYLRPLLTLMPYQGVRVVLHGVLFTLGIYFCSLLFQQKTWGRLAALITAALSVDFLYLGQSMQFSSVFILGLTAACIALTKGRHWKNLTILFFITGGLTSFFDLLTAPLVSLGLLLLVTTDHKQKKQLFLHLVFWSLGYATLWISKWIILELYFHHPAISEAVFHVVDRTVHAADADFTPLKALILNVRQLRGYAKSNKIFWLGAVMLAGVFFLVFRKKKVTAGLLSELTTWGALASIPYAWYLLVANHSYLHVWFTYRNQLLSVAAAVLFYVTLIDWEKVQHTARHLKKMYSFVPYLKAR